MRTELGEGCPRVQRRANKERLERRVTEMEVKKLTDVCRVDWYSYTSK